MKSLRQFIGAVGLLIVAVCGSLVVLSLVTNPGTTPTLLIWTGLGLAGVDRRRTSQAGLAYRVTVEWLLVLMGLVLGLGVVAFLFAAVMGVVFGSDGGGSIATAVRFLGYAVGTAMVVAWASRDPARAAILKALGRAAVARASSDDARLLAGGPGHSSAQSHRPAQAPRTPSASRHGDGMDGDHGPRDGRPRHSMWFLE